MYLFLRKYVSDVLEGTGMLDCKTGGSSMILMLTPSLYRRSHLLIKEGIKHFVGKAKLSFIIYSDISFVVTLSKRALIHCGVSRQSFFLPLLCCSLCCCSSAFCWYFPLLFRPGAALIFRSLHVYFCGSVLVV